MLVAVLAALVFSASSLPPFFSETRSMMGSRITIDIAAVSEDRARRAADDAFAVFDRVNEVMNEWRPDSPLSALNAVAGNGAWVALPGDLCTVLEIGVAGAARTNGLFDPTWAALRKLWNFGPAGQSEPPSDRALADACPLVSYRDLEIEPGRGGCRARLRRAGMQVGLGGIAKGWAVDRAVAALRAHRLRDFAVQAGGDLYVAGHRRGRPWIAGIRDPRGAADEAFASVEVSDRAFSTSGDYEHFFLSKGRRYHHIIDPRTCRSAPTSRSVSVLARSATDAEILTKAAFILGGREGLALVERAGAQAVIVTSKNEVLVSRSLGSRVRWRSPSP